MRASSSLTEDQRSAAVALFEDGRGSVWVAGKLSVSKGAAAELHKRWRVRGRTALTEKPDRTRFSQEFKLTVVQRVLAGESRIELAREYGLSSAKIIDPWVRIYRSEGADGLRSKRRGRPPAPPGSAAADASELEQLRAENERLRTQVAYLGKLRALRDQKRR
ncbi:helix-turn-helix domain-containing protein [Rhodococcoides kyotonense]|uniref:Transposase and inactivated derivatives n=1 Tax=Rhodococcoides kyotonense TaxID=398843 RepID=A0A239I8S9_9NOCA|nr:helix-turn-helix domain-containing protein [Rhodococcus kyotonensis]SNS89812.1 Transposase and inactivated derivatives [Rhodococcus kyotonensis]